MAADSLVISNLIECLGGPGGVQSDISALVNAAGVGAVFRLLAPPSTGGTALSPQLAWDLGTPQPTTSQVQSLLLDGERPFGTRASNRTITLPIKITAPDQVTLSAAKEYLMQLVDQPSWTLRWTPASTGLTMVFDCFRALPTVYSYGFLPGQPSPIAIITLQFQALPYGRTDTSGLTDVAFASPLLGGVAAPPAPVTLDNFAAVSGTNWAQTTQFVVGPHSARYTPPNTTLVPVTYSKSGLTANITGLPVLSVWLGQGYDTVRFLRPPATFTSNVTMRWTLTDNGGHVITFHRTVSKVPWSNTGTTPKWFLFSSSIPQGVAGFNYASVASYSVTMSNEVVNSKSVYARMVIWLDAVVANPPSLASPASQRGVVYKIMGTPGTARTPVSCQFQLPQSGSVSAELSGSGLWWPPVGVTSAQAECIGGGGAGGTRSTSGAAGGGGGGEYAAEATLTVAAGTPVPYSCGAGGTTGAAQQVITFTQAGNGSWTCPANVTAVKAECWGGGARGADGGGGGGGGEYAAEATLAVTAGKSYAFFVGAGGIFTLDSAARANGQTSTFAGDSVTVTAHGGIIPASGSTVGGTGGHGSTNTTHNNGGTGGTSPSYGGGGGGGSGGTSGAGNTGGNGSGNTGGTGAAAVTGGGAGGAGANNPGFPALGSAPGGGGGGGYGNLGNQPGANGAAGQVRLTYTIGAGSPVNGGTTTFGSTATTGTVVTAHGGQSVALNTTTGGTGGTGSANTTHNNGGAGGLGGTNGGGGGGSGGSGSVGNAGTAGASGGAGAQAVTGGGKGANGGAATVDVGDGASPPGGGGGGAVTTGATEAGGSGGAGRIIVTWTPPLAPFSTLVAHRPSATSPQELNPCVPIGNTADTPSGMQYTVPSLVPGVNALFNGTYTVVLTAYNWDSPSSSRSVSVSVNQFEYAGGPVYSTTITRAFTPSTDITNGFVIMGELTLPVKYIDPSNLSAYFTVSVNDTDVNDQFLDVIFLDTQGSTVLVNIPPGNTYVNMFIDEATPERDLGLILGSDLDRSQAVSILDYSIVSGSPFYITQGDNTFFAYAIEGAPNLGVSFENRWYLERQV
jgi:hypothetical protein